MLMGSVALLLLTCAGAAGASAEKVVWEALSISPAGDRKVIAGGARTYAPATDVLFQERTGPKGKETWQSNSLHLDDTFVLSAIVQRAPKLKGFRLAIHRLGDEGFSWESFDRVEGGVFQKRGGEGSVSVRVKESGGQEELEGIEFLDDIVLRYLDDPSKAKTTPTHEITVRKGSVFRWGASQAP
jgi:hypothetical protein